MRSLWSLAVVCASLCAGASVAQAAAGAGGPAFDCSRAEGTVQKLVCADAGLAALDRQLDGVYKAAAGKARDGMGATLKAEQRGWIKGRDDCWKAAGTRTWMTESWVVDDVRSCVDASYQLRIAELQVRWQLVPAKAPVAYGCNGNPANEVTVQLFDSTLPAGRFERGDQTVVGYLVKSASGARYEGRNLAFAGKGQDATVKWLDEELKCRAK